jgi:hypothetical protein
MGRSRRRRASYLQKRALEGLELNREAVEAMRKNASKRWPGCENPIRWQVKWVCEPLGMGGRSNINRAASRFRNRKDTLVVAPIKSCAYARPPLESGRSSRDDKTRCDRTNNCRTVSTTRIFMGASEPILLRQRMVRSHHSLSRSCAANSAALRSMAMRFFQVISHRSSFGQRALGEKRVRPYAERPALLLIARPFEELLIEKIASGTWKYLRIARRLFPARAGKVRRL